MTLILREDDVRRVLMMPDAIDALEIAFREWGNDQANNSARQRIVLKNRSGVLHMLAGAVPALDSLGFKAYTAFPTGARFVVNLYSASTGELKAIIEADWLGRMRTGAASGLATKYLANKDASTVAVLGSGGQAETQIVAMAAVRQLSAVRVYSRNAERLHAFTQRLSEQLSLHIVPSSSAEEAVRGADIIVTATNSKDPVVAGAWIKSGAHINAMGSNWHHRREIDTEAVQAATRIFADSVEQAHVEAGDLIIPASTGKLDWSRVQELSAVVAGKLPGRASPADITVFKSMGIGLEDVAVAAKIYELARSQGLGEDVALLQ